MESDLQIQKNVTEELEWEPRLNASEIGVYVRHGIVTLSGTVSSYAEKLAAEQATKRVKGVRAVAEDITVRSDSSKNLTDTHIADNVLRTLDWNTSIPHDRLSIRVDDGWVYLEGEVDWIYQKEAAEQYISELRGVTGISNSIAVKPAATEDVIKANIHKALERSADLEADRIFVEIQGHKVIIKGTVRSWNERTTIERAISSAPGVLEVEDQLAVVY